MKRITAIGFTSAMLLSFAACNENTASDDSGTNDTTTVDATTSTKAIELTDVPASPDFAGATLNMGEIVPTIVGDSVKLNFNFNVTNYELKAQTADASEKLCNNSKDGQHIHFILDNKPYAALYEKKHTTTVAKNTEHYLVAFLSRSYHQSLKNKEAALVYHFKVDENGKVVKLDAPTTPMLTYSRPKGDYLGKDTENILLDFYVWNATLGNDYKVKADINTGGKDTSIMISEWKSYFLKNLAMGKSTIKLTLVDKDGNQVNGPETEVSRDINLAMDEPMK